LTITKY